MQWQYLDSLHFAVWAALLPASENWKSKWAASRGSPVHEDKMSLMKVMKGYIGKNVELEFSGEDIDSDLVSVTMRKGSCIIEDVDKDWVKVHVTYDKTDKVKLIRLQEISSVKGINS